MRKPVHPDLSKCRIRDGKFGSSDSLGNTGAFMVPHLKTNVDLRVIASEAESWDHVSISLPTRCPNWPEMCFIKDLFWSEEECVIQYHPPKSKYVNMHPYCLHLWKPWGVELPEPPMWMVGLK